MKYAENFSFAKIFTSHMVLQREKKILFYGKADPGCGILLTVAGKSFSAVADDRGKWFCQLQPLTETGPFEVVLKGSDNVPEVKLEDVVAGEVWLCAGQSNMQMPIGGDDPFFRTEDPEAILAGANQPQIRLFNYVPEFHLSPDSPDEDFSGDVSWQVCSAQTAENFSACGYFFGKQLQSDLQVPIGLISAPYRGTEIGAWISREEMEKESLTPLCEDPPALPQAVWSTLIRQKQYDPLHRWLREFDSLGTPPPEYALPDYDDRHWEPVPAKTFLPRPGRFCMRITFELRQDILAEKILPGIINDTDKCSLDGVFLGGCNVETRAFYMHKRSYDTPEKHLKRGKHVLLITADNHCGAGWIDAENFQLEGSDGARISPEISCRLKEVFVLPEDYPPRPEIPPLPADRSRTSPQKPSTLFNAMLHAVFPFKVRGVLWYQGCSNAGELRYYQMLKLLIREFRTRWNEPELPILLVQLAAFDSHHPAAPFAPESLDARLPEEYPQFAVLREIQHAVADTVPHVGIITAFDCGATSDYHPKDKKTIGIRLAKKAEQMVYGKNDILCDSPVFAGIRFEGSKIRVFFKHAAGGLKTKDAGPVRGFVIGGRCGQLFHADAEIDGETVLVSSPFVPEPQRVRYAFAGFCRANLINRSGLPAMPFRSDSFNYQAMFSDRIL